MEDKKLTEKESLEVITSMIARTKARYLGSGNILLMWGYLAVFSSILVWILLAATQQNVWNWLWFAIPVIGMPLTSIMARREKRTNGVVTYSDKITSHLWSIFGVSEIVLTLICLGFSLIGGIKCWTAMIVYTIIAAPFAEIAQGLIVKEKSLTWGGIVGLAIGMVLVCCVTGKIPLLANWFMPLFILFWVVMMIVPGHIINHKAKKG
ncbi:hypothetical protein [Barnesiella sp. CU968]|jgi:hypothetical protein|uniref:hypothetical protein n=1 Tax=Barnesiella sp. CU968 TaxID=2780099 RepID=UPI00195AE3F2|nr:hypothetical protein [Barnesiella sp. CU968]MBJ2197770.1 hypothetical protein [Muribaculaceae bacterium]MCI9030408.1 hypothetical protein [Muribaculaceae bacterium]